MERKYQNFTATKKGKKKKKKKKLASKYHYIVYAQIKQTLSNYCIKHLVSAEVKLLEDKSFTITINARKTHKSLLEVKCVWPCPCNGLNSLKKIWNCCIKIRTIWLYHFQVKPNNLTVCYLNCSYFLEQWMYVLSRYQHFHHAFT